ncbi:HlyU family transcriptional regulator [Thalassococcus sp. BH17M4-6]|uniref:HlyU family transcriptional regulator n=1 Tax=Thalassococcus sp. BH17M4-6 TaxID=3413148 RepID=UPI003BDFC42C
MSLFRKLFGGGSRPDASPAAPPEEYEGFRIYPEPQSVDGQFRIGARIERDEDGETRTHQLIRADLLRDRDDAVEASLRKARQVIDEQGSRLFG